MPDVAGERVARMTDTRLPEHFLTSPTLDGLTSDAFRVYANGLMWSVTHGTDGLIPDRALRLLHPDGRRLELAAELHAAGLWHHDDAGYHVPDFLKYQTPAEQVEKARTLARERKRKQRDREAAGDSDEDEVGVSRVTERVTDGVSHGEVTEDRTETGHDAVKRGTYGTFVGAQTEDEHDAEPVAPCYACKTPNHPDAVKCSFCQNRLTDDLTVRRAAS